MLAESLSRSSLSSKPLIARFSFLQSSVLASVFLVVVLFSWSFSGPANSGFDSTYHLGNIWCSHGERSGICEDLKNENGQLSGNIPSELATGTSSTELVTAYLASSTTKSPYYSIMGYLVSQNVTQSVLLMRMFSSALVGLLFFSLIYFSSRRIRAAIITSWTFTISPILIGTLWQTNPRSWGYLSVMSGWAFLYMALNGPHRTRRNYAHWTLFSISCLLAFTSRKDASMFLVFICVIVLLVHLMRSKKVSVKRLALLFVAFVSAFSVIRYFFASIKWYTQIDIKSIFDNSRAVFVLVHLPENIADAFGLGLRYHDIGPNTIGIIGLSLFTYSLSGWLKNGNGVSFFAVSFTSLFLFLVMFQISFNWPETTPASGVYTAALLPVILGFAVLYAQNIDGVVQTKTSLSLVIALLSLAHALTLFSKFEWSIRDSAVNDTYTKLSLNGGWWWNVPVGPNYAYILGVLAFPTWLFFSWIAVDAQNSD
jgi:hypothetical protein